MQETILVALGLTALAGLSTTIGSFLGLIFKNPGPRFMSVTLGFSPDIEIDCWKAQIHPDVFKMDTDTCVRNLC